MPFSQPLSYPSPNFWSTQVGRCAHCARNVLVKETVLKPGVERRREAMSGQKGVRSSLSCGRVSLVTLMVVLRSHTLAVNKDVCTLAVRT
jgi:hypothetical protein